MSMTPGPVNTTTTHTATTGSSGQLYVNFPSGTLAFQPTGSQVPFSPRESWRFQKAILMAELKLESRSIAWMCLSCGALTSAALALFIGIPARTHGVRLDGNWFYWAMVSAPYPLSVGLGIMVRRWINKWADKFLGD